ncbi:MFS family permease [Kocuria marina]
MSTGRRTFVVLRRAWTMSLRVRGLLPRNAEGFGESDVSRETSSGRDPAACAPFLVALACILGLAASGLVPAPLSEPTSPALVDRDDRRTEVPVLLPSPVGPAFLPAASGSAPDASVLWPFVPVFLGVAVARGVVSWRSLSADFEAGVARPPLAVPALRDELRSGVSVVPLREDCLSLLAVSLGPTAGGVVCSWASPLGMRAPKPRPRPRRRSATMNSSR